jgi:cobalamin-dependent methionine synthase I
VKHWGYVNEETFDTDDLLHEKYQGIRPAPGYPAQPDHLEKVTMWKLMNVCRVEVPWNCTHNANARLPNKLELS